MQCSLDKLQSGVCFIDVTEGLQINVQYDYFFIS